MIKNTEQNMNERRKEILCSETVGAGGHALLRSKEQFCKEIVVEDSKS